MRIAQPRVKCPLTVRAPKGCPVMHKVERSGTEVDLQREFRKKGHAPVVEELNCFE